MFWTATDGGHLGGSDRYVVEVVLGLLPIVDEPVGCLETAIAVWYSPARRP